MGENTQQRPDPEALAKMCADKVQPLSKVFCSMEGKTAVVSGGASGLGYQVVNRLCEAGARVVIADVREDRGERAVSEFREKGYETAFFKTDVRNVKECYALEEYTEKTYGTPDILVTCAARWSCYSYLDLPEEVYDLVMDADLKGSYFLGQAVARAMVRDKVKGKIVFVSSAAHMGEGPLGLGMNSYYAAAKAGVVAMTRTVAGELKQYGIQVNCVAPGGMLTAGVFTEGTEAPSLYGDEYLAVRQANGSKSMVTFNPDEVALAIYALCTPMSDFMCGETVNVNGGALMIQQEKPFSFTVEGCIPGPKKQ